MATYEIYIIANVKLSNVKSKNTLGAQKRSLIQVDPSYQGKTYD
jgi:hypothetical protein